MHEGTKATRSSIALSQTPAGCEVSRCTTRGRSSTARSRSSASSTTGSTIPQVTDGQTVKIKRPKQQPQDHPCDGRQAPVKFAKVEPIQREPSPGHASSSGQLHDTSAGCEGEQLSMGSIPSTPSVAAERFEALRDRIRAKQRKRGTQEINDDTLCTPAKLAKG